MDANDAVASGGRRVVQTDESNVNKLKEAQLRTERTILEAEKFRSRVEPPGNEIFLQDIGTGSVEGKSGNNTNTLNMLNIGSGVSDDDFFHLTCHIDPNLIHKIEKGEFVELEKLLPKDKIGKNNDENRLEWVQRDGGTYLVPAQ